MESANWKKQKVQLRRGTAAEWTARNTLLLPAEPGYETDTGRLKLGDGLTRWNSLAYWGAAEVSSGDYGQVIVNQDGTWSVDITSADIGASAVGHTHSASEIASGTLSDSRLSGNVVLTSDARLSDARTPLSHTHDDRYYTEAEVDSLLAGKQAAGTYATLVGGTVPTNQLPTYVQSVAGRSGAVTLAKADVGLSNVDNTSDANKPISTAAQTALDLKAPLASPTFTGVVTVPAGTAALPAIVSATGTADTGVWFPGADTIAVSTGGIQRVRVTSAGRTLVAGNQSFKAERTSDLGLVAQSGLTVRGSLESGVYPETATYGVATCYTPQVLDPAVGTLLLRFHWPIGARIRWRIRGSNFNGGDSAYTVDWQTYPSAGWLGQDKSLIASGDPTFKQVRILQDADTATTRLAYLALGATTTGWDDDVITIDADVGWSGAATIDWSQCQWSMVTDETGLSVFAQQSATVEPGRIYGRSLVAVDGTAASPTFAWNADQDTGVFSPAANEWAVSVGGVERLRVSGVSGQRYITFRDSDGTTERHKWDLEEGFYWMQGVIRSAITMRGNYGAGATDVGGINFRNATDTLVGRMDCNSTTAGVDTKGSFRWQTSDGAGVGVTRALLDENGLQLGDGSASLPSLSNIGDTNTGIWFPAADAWAVSTGGVERVRIDSAGRILVATSVSRSAGPAVHPVFQFEGTTAGAVSYQCICGSTTANVSPQILLARHRGAVGGSDLVLNGDSLGVIRFNGGDGTDCVSTAAQIECKVDGEPGSNDMPGALLLSTASDGASAATERVRITAAGLVGIGTTSPTALLDVDSNTMRLRTARTPASAAAAGNVGDICWDTNYVYVCVATNTWKRSALSTW